MTNNQRFAVWASVLLILVPLAAGQRYRITDLGTFPGGTVSEGDGINNLGQVAGYARFANTNAHGTVWSESMGLVDLGSIPPLSNFSVAQGINSFGDVVGYSDYNQLQAQYAVLWRRGKLINLGTLPGGTESQANAINDREQIAGWSNGGNISPHATLWTIKGGPLDLGTLPGGYYSQGVAINIETQVVGFSNVTTGDWYAFLWSKSAGMQTLPNLPGSRPPASANGINDLGEVVGGTGSYAALWHNDRNHTPQNLGTLLGQTWSTAFAVNNAGQVVGWSGFIAFVWTQDRGMQDLNKLIPSDSGWSLSVANSINVRGQITGQGTINGEQHGFLLTPIQ
jgi:probable HAF family extracellular repeat protein